MARDLRMAQTGDVTMGGQRRLTLTGGWRGKHPARFPSGPVPVRHPSGRCLGVSPARPGAELHPGEVIHATAGGLTHPGARVMSPTPNWGVELVDHGRLRPVLPQPHDPTPLREMRLDVGLGRCDQGFVPEALMASGSFPGLVLPYPILAEVEAQNIPSRLLACQGVTARSVVRVQRQPDLRQPCPEALLTVVENGPIRVQDQAVISVSDHVGLRIDLGAGRVHPMQGDQRSQRRDTAALRGTCGGGGERVRLHDP